MASVLCSKNETDLIAPAYGACMYMLCLHTNAMLAHICDACLGSLPAILAMHADMASHVFTMTCLRPEPMYA